jgi:2,3-bisphosphoglycerate-dependent phosphoglycerate mutase
MKLLFSIDKKNYNQNAPVFRRPSVRGIILRDGRVAMMHSLKYSYYKLPGGESLNEVKERVIRGFEWVLAQYKGKNVVVGSHGTALAVLLNYLDPAFGYEQLKEMTMPWIVCVTEDNDKKTLSYCKI